MVGMMDPHAYTAFVRHQRQLAAALEGAVSRTSDLPALSARAELLASTAIALVLK